ncbi:MAG: mannose-1-phosphate guanylyltransferase [Planctomycetota bacterium]
MPNLHAVIMAGGSGTRFWPASRARRPKQFLPLARGSSLLQATVTRMAAVAGRERTWIATNPRQAETLDQAVAGFPRERVIVEPEARDTAPCVALAAAVIGAHDADAVLAVVPADHLIEPQAHFETLLQRAVAVATEHHMIVTFGIRPRGPATGYGYIERGERLDEASPAAFRVARFREKPDLDTARRFVGAGNFAWNSGMFVWTLPDLLTAMASGAPELAAATQAMQQAARAGDPQALHTAFARCPKTSIDFAVMERAPRVAMIEADLAWSDVGSFTSLDAVHPPDARGNVTVLAEGARAVVKDARDCVVYGEGRRLVALFGTSDLVVVAVDDAVLVCPKDRSDDLKKLIEHLRESGHGDVL